MMLRWAGLLAAVLVVGAVSLAEPSPASAECPRIDYWPRMREAAPAVTRVVIGTVRDFTTERRRHGDGREVAGFTIDAAEDVKGSGPTDPVVIGGRR